jgi:hypothetical protein
MTLYFNIHDVLDRLEKTPEEGHEQNVLIDVTTTPPQTGDFPEDTFLLASTPRLLDLESHDAPRQLAKLLEEAPLYHINMELALDEALTQRHRNATVLKALEKAFVSETLPSTLQIEEKKPDDIAGSLRHPMLGHIDIQSLCSLYLGFLNALGGGRQDFSFENYILGAREKRFLEHFDGFLQGGQGKIKADILLGFGHRHDHDPAKKLEDYVQEGQKKARRMNITDPQELVWAWLEADNYQMRRCLDIHRLKSIHGLSRLPAWVHADIFSLLEKEAMKQHFSEALAQADTALALLGKTPLLKKSLQLSAQGHVDELLQQLLSQTLNVGASYSGAAHKFADAAAQRRREAQRARLI